MSRPLDGRVALVAGATRGAGRGTAVALGEAGAIVYCTGRTTRDRRSEYDRPETIEETAELVTDAGGVGIAVPVDHLDAGQVQALVERIDAEQGRLHVLVNDVWGGELLFEWNAPCGSTTSTMACGCCDSILRLGFRAGRGARAARLHCGGAHAGLDALGDDARALRGHRGELARRSGHEPAFGLLALPGRGPG